MEENESNLAAASDISSALTIKIANLSTSCKKKNPTTAAISSLVSTVEPSPYNSPSLISPPSSAFVSALQSPYISPRALTPKSQEEEEVAAAPLHSDEHPKCASSSSGHSDDLPSSSYTPPSDQYEFSDDPNDGKLKFLPYVPVQVPVTEPTGAPPRISFSFPVPRVSFTKGPSLASPVPAAAANTKLRSCDLFVGFHGQSPNLVRFCKWLKSELELQGIACFVADRAKYSDAQSHEIADRVICSVTFGIVVLTNSSFLNPMSVEEVRFFTQKKNLVPIFFDAGASEILGLLSCSSADKDSKEAIERLVKYNEFKLEANEGNWRSCIARAASILRSKLGRTSVAEKDAVEAFEEIPFPRNRHFIGRESLIMEMEGALFGCGESFDQESTAPVTRGEVSGQSEGLADEESESLRASRGGRFISLEVVSSNKSNEPKLEAWVEPVLGRNSFKRLSKCKKSRIGSGVICLNGVPGIGKTELALEYAHRFSQRYKMVLWVGGEARYFRQNILNLSVNLGLDISADPEKERGRIRSFDEQEIEAFKRVKRELFRDMPYLIIIDNLETEREWWEGKDLHDLIPRNTGGSHVIITTRLPKVMNFDILPVPPLPISDSVILLRGRRMREYPERELEVLQKFAEKLGRVSFGMCIVGSLISELGILPSALYEQVNRIALEGLSDQHSLTSLNDEQFCKNNPFLMKVLSFCFNVVQQFNGRRNLLAAKMLLTGAWFAPAPVPAILLATAAKSMAETVNQFEKWSKLLDLSCCLAPKAWKTEEDSAVLLVKFGLARRSNRSQGYCIQFHPITQLFSRRKDCSPLASSSLGAKAMIQAVRRTSNPVQNLHQLWASVFLVFGFKSEPPLVQLKPIDAVLYIKKTAMPLAIRAFTTFSRCNSALELLKVCTNVLEEVEKSFVSQIQDRCHGSLCWKKPLQGMNTHGMVDEYVWQDVTLLKAMLLETRAKLLLRGGHFDSGEELCRTCISIRTVMLGHNHTQTLAAQETLAKLVRMRSKI